MKELAYIDILRIFNLCHGPKTASGTTPMRWFEEITDKIGMPQDSEGGFLIRSRVGVVKDLFLQYDGMSWSMLPERAKRCDWEETAIRITNNPTLEAIIINYLNIAVDCKGKTVAYLPKPT